MNKYNFSIIIKKIYFKATTRLSEKYLSKIRKKFLRNKDFTIISNNCWAGWVYRRYNLPYMTPTIGLFIMPDDYIKFIKDIKKYISMDLEFIDPNNSRYAKYISEMDERFGKYPIGKLDDIEIHFLHYKDKQEAIEKWNRRKERINYDNLIIKFNDQNGCRKENIEDFNQLQYENKILFGANDDIKKVSNKSNIYIKEFKKVGYVQDDMLFCTKYINLTKYINSMNNN